MTKQKIVRILLCVGFVIVVFFLVFFFFDLHLAPTNYDDCPLDTRLSLSVRKETNQATCIVTNTSAEQVVYDGIAVLEIRTHLGWEEFRRTDFKRQTADRHAVGYFLEPGETVSFTVHADDLLQAESGSCRFVVPMTTADGTSIAVSDTFAFVRFDL